MYLSIYRSIDLSLYLSIYLSISVCLSVYLSVYLQAWKRSSSARLPHFRSWTTSKTKQFCDTSSFLNWTTSKTKQFRETYSMFELDNFKNKAILRDFLQKSKVECSAESLVPMRFAIFPLHLSKVLHLPRKIDARSYEVPHLSRKIILANLQIWCLKNATPLRKSAPWPPNISDKHVFCTTPATRNASLPPDPAIVFGNATKPSRFAHFWEGAQSLAHATWKHIWTSKSAPYPSVFCTFDFEMRFAPQRRALFRHLNFQKWSENGVFSTFWLRNVLRATTACTFSTSQLPKVVRTWCVLYILTSKCASCHSGVQFFISHLARWLRTRRFSEPTFRPSGATNHWKNKVSRDFPTFSRICIFFLLTLSLLWSSLFCSSLLSDSSHLCFSSVHIVGSLILNFLRWREYPKMVMTESIPCFDRGAFTGYIIYIYNVNYIYIYIYNAHVIYIYIYIL